MNINKIILILMLLLASVSSASANLRDGKYGDEEAACFELLNEAVKNDSRFKDTNLLPDGDLSNVLYDESNNSYYDFSNYNNFWNAAVENPNKSGSPNWDNYYFEARRNNIGTIISGSNYIYSQISGFGRDSNFDFPLESKTGTPFGDKYKLRENFFKEYVIYTHHIKDSGEDFPLLSCGIAKVIPLGGKTFSEINESGYMTNILNGIAPQSNLGGSKCASGFEGGYDSEDGEDFYKMKANVCVQSYDESDYLKLELISIAYDNDSERLNEYYTHPLQVEAMSNNANHAQGLKGIQDVFRSKLENETCYSVIHGSRKSDLPARCSNSFGPISYNLPGQNILDYIFPSVHAERGDVIDLPETTEKELEDTGMLAYGDLSYKLYKKLESIPDESFREYMLLSILPNFEELIQHRTDNDILLTPFEEVFLSCNLDYNDRLSVVSDFLDRLDIDNFSLSNLDYSVESFGDCIIPYPDKDKITIVVEGSFESNKLLAEKLNGTYAPNPDAPEVAEYIKNREALLVDLNLKLQEIDSLFNAGEIDSNRANVLKREQQEKTQIEMDSIDFSPAAVDELQDEIIKNNIEVEGNKSNDKLIYILILLLVLLGIGSISFAFYKKNKKS